ncbi:MAG: hypothetical protein RIQ52_177 [Pseudomonadota bacterium]
MRFPCSFMSVLISMALLLQAPLAHPADPVSSSIKSRILATSEPVKLTVPAAADETLTLRDIGAGHPLLLTGTEDGESLWFGVRSDEVIHRALLRIRYTASPALIPELSHIKIYLNQEVIAVIDLPRDKAGKVQTQEIELDPRFLVSSNNLRFQLVGHYTRDCEDPMHSSLWVNVSNLSELQLWTRHIQLPNDLALFPTPFLDNRSNQRMPLPFHFQEPPDTHLVRAAGILASWFGTQAGKRRLNYSVSYGPLPEQHAILLLSNDHLPEPLALAPVAAPTILITQHPDHPDIKYLVIMGKTTEEAETAASALVLGNGILSGAVASVTKPALPPARQPYDSPHWVSTEHVTRLGDLVRNAAELQVSGSNPPPIRIDFRMPPDLLLWQHSDIRLDLNYRYTPPITEEQSFLSLYTNGNLLKAMRLKRSSDEASLTQRVQMMANDHVVPESLRIPAFQLGADNTLEMKFFSSDYRQGWCMTSSVDSFFASIDADSTLDFRGFYHYAIMPDLGSFSRSGFPFTRLADLAETQIVLPGQPSAMDIKAALVMLSEMGLSTGVPALRFGIQFGDSADNLRGKDLLVISTTSTHPLIRQWAAYVPASFDDEARTFGQDFEWNRVFQFTDLDTFRQKLRYIGANSFRTEGTLAALTGFESPIDKGRSVISFEANSDEEAERALLTFTDRSAMRFVEDDVAIFRRGSVQTYEVGPHYYAGELPVWMWLGFHLTRHPVLMALSGLGSGLVIAFYLYASVQRLRHRRLGTG